MALNNYQDADFTPDITPSDVRPNMGTYNSPQTFRFWCQKVLPLVYDDSLSYYELLCKVVDYLNKTMEDVNTAVEDVENLNSAFGSLENHVNASETALIQAYNDLQDYVNTYFNNLDVQEEINNKLDAMVEDGTLDTILLPYFNAYTEATNEIIDGRFDAQNTILNNQTGRIAVLEGRMDTFSSLPDGSLSTSADAELVDIRVSTNGTTYPSAGDSVRGQIDSLSDHVDVLNEKVLSQVPQSVSWENGSFEAGGYADLPSTTVTRKRSTKLPGGTYTIIPTTNLRWEAFYYVSDTSGTQIYSFNASKRTFTANGQFIITIGKDGGGSLDGLEVEISQFGIYRQNDELINIKTINHDSYSVNSDRYEHITYIDRLNGVTIENGNASDVRLNFDVGFKNTPYSIRLTTNPSRTSSEIRLNYAESFTLLGTQEFELYLYVKDATIVTEARISIPSASFVKNITGLVNGWNKLRFFSEGAGNWDSTANITQIRVMVYHTSGATEEVYIGSLVQVKPQYANLILIADGPYYSTYSAAYPTLKTMGVPITWALDATTLDSVDAQTRGLINMNELNLLAKDGISEFSFHSYDGTLMSSASKEQALYDTLNSIRFLRENGLQPNHVWRAAWLQNSCANPELANLEVEASASYNNESKVSAFPFANKYNIARFGVAARNESWFDNIFERMRMQHCTAVLYFHGVSNSERDITTEMLSYFIEKIQTAITAGYLNPTTYNRLISYYKKVE